MPTKTSAKKKAPEKNDITQLVRDFLKAKTSGRRGYERADRLLAEISKQVSPGQEFELWPGKKAKLKDRFAEGAKRGVIFTPCATRRWELELIDC
ncbi:MAG: hypothetical protein ACRD4R_06770 [Candidatus Acidiferrales bacterium]